MRHTGTFKPEAIEQLYAAYAEKHGSEMGYDGEAQSFAEAYDYMTCERPNGSKYGTGGQCRKGKETTPGSEDKPKKPATSKQIASAEAKLEKLKTKLNQAEEKESDYEAIARNAGYGRARGIATARAQAGPRRMAEKWRNKAMELGGQVREQQRLVNEMKGIKEAPKPAPAPAPPKTPLDIRRDKLRKLESSINSRAGAIISKHGKDSPQFQKFFAKYAPKLEKVQGELRNTMFGGDFAEAYDYMTCERPDGSKYGTGGQCRKGKETTPGSEDKPKPKRARKKAEEEGIGAPVPSAEDVKAMTDRMKEGREWTRDHEEVWNRILATPDTKALGSLTRKLNKEVFDQDKYNVSAGFLGLGLKKMKEWLQANGRSGVGAKREAERANMTPEELRRANTADRIQRGIRGGVVNPRMR